MKRIITLFYICIPTLFFAQNIEEIAKKFWKAVEEKNYNVQVSCGPKIVDYFKNNKFPVDSTYLDFLFRLGSAYVSLNEHENAKNIFSESQKLCETYYGKNNYNTTFHKYALVNTYKKLENKEMTLILAKECLSEFDKFKGPENDYSILMILYLNSSFELSNKLDSAAFYANEQVKRTKKMYGLNSESYVNALFSLARIYKNQLNYKDAKILFSECIELSKSIFNEKHYTHESGLFYLGEINMELGLFYESIKNNEIYLELRKNIYGENDLLYANSLNNLANCYQNLGEYNKSLSLNQQCYTIRKNLLGENHEHTWNSLNNIALNYSFKGDWKLSLKINQELVNKKKQILSENSLSYIQSLSNLAVDYGNLSVSDTSFLLSVEAYNLLKNNGLKKTSLFSTVTQNIAFSYLTNGLLDSAELFINKSLENIEQLQGINSLSYIESLEILTTILKSKGKYEEALINLKVIHDFKIANYSIGSFLYAKSLSELSSFYNDLGYYQLAVDSIQKALPIYIKSQGEKHVLTLQTMSKLALYLNNLGKIKEGLKINLDVLEKRGQTIGFQNDDYLTSLINTAENYKSLADYEKSRNLYLRAISIQEKKTSSLNTYLFTTALSNYGSLLVKMEKKDSSYYFSKKALDYTRKMGVQSEDYVIKLNNLGYCYLNYHDFALAKVYFDSASFISENIFGSNHPSTVQCLENLAAAFGDIGEYSKAIDIEISCLNRIAERRGKENLEYASGLHQLAYYDSKIGLDSLALKWNKEAYLIRKDILGPKHPSTLLSSYNIAVDYNNLGNYKEALKILEENLKINIELYGPNSRETKLVYNNIGLVYYDLKDYKKALEYIMKAIDEIEYFDHQDAVFINLSSVYEKMGDFTKAIEFQEKAVSYYLNNYLKNQLFLPEKQKTIYKQKLDYYVNYLVDLNLNSGFDDRNYSWYNFFISSKNLINTQSNDFLSNISNDVKNDLLNIMDQIKLLKVQQNKFIEQNNQSKLYEIQNEKEKLEIKYSTILGNSLKKPMNYKMIQKNLKSESDIFVDVIPVFAPNKISIYYVANVISNNEIYVNLLDTNVNLDYDLYNEYQRQASDYNYKTDLKSARFYTSFWKPIADKIGDAKTIYVSLGGVYNNINLNTIYNPTTGKYLVEEKDFRIVNSARDFVLSKEREKKNYTSNTASLFGFPNFDGNTTVFADTSDLFASTRDLNSFWLDSLTRGGMKAKPLPATKIEVENISATLKSKGWQVNSFLADNASEINIKKQQSPRILHVATHGYFFQDIPLEKDNNRFLGMDREQVVQDPMLRSGLLLTGANKTLKGETIAGENGLLSAAEASLLDLGETELVVLSACETGKGEVKNSEGVYGLRKAFSDAGAQNIIMSLWKVDDKVTQEFMSRFYEIWLNDKSTIRAAFNKTQLEIKAKYPQPYYWGAFILVGE